MANPKFPFVSVVICTFNRGNVINACLNSLEHQIYPKDSYELIVVDDCSTDDTPQIARAHRGVSVIRHETNRGIPSARNTGLAAAKGEVIVYIDDDAVADPHWLECLVQPFDDSNVTASGGQTFAYKTEYIAERYLAANGYGNPAPLAFGQSKNPLWRFWVYLKSMFISVSIATQPTEVQAVYGLNCAFRTQALRTIGGFDKTLLADEDSEICTRLRSGGARIIFIPGAIIHHRHRESVIKLLRQTFRRAEYTVYYYAKENKTLPIFPFPVLYVVLAICFLLIKLSFGIFFVVIGPLILYAWWPIRAFRDHESEYFIYGYIQLALELAAILGIAWGKLKI